MKKQKLKKQKTKSQSITLGILLGIIISIVYFIIKRRIIPSILIIIITPILSFLFFYLKNSLKKSERIKKMENIFPDFLQLMASNLRAGITIDKSMLLSVRKEFNPLDKEIQQTGRDIATGKEIEIALLDMSKRIKSEKIHKTILLLISGIRSGGNLATLLEETSVNMRERGFVEKKASSNVLMYVIFIFVAVAIGGPLLFGLSSLLVGTLTNLLSGMPSGGAEVTNLPFTMSAVTISSEFVKYFALVFIISTDILAALVLGLVNKGEEREGIKYLPALLILSLATFFIIRLALGGFMQGLFGA